MDRSVLLGHQWLVVATGRRSSSFCGRSTFPPDAGSTHGQRTLVSPEMALGRARMQACPACRTDRAAEAWVSEPAALQDLVAPRQAAVERAPERAMAERLRRTRAWVRVAPRLRAARVPPAALWATLVRSMAAAIPASHPRPRMARHMVMRGKGESAHLARRSLAWRPLALAVLLGGCNLNPRPEDPGFGSSDKAGGTPGGATGSGGSFSSGAGGEGAIFVGSGGAPTSVPPVRVADSGASATDAGPADAGPADAAAPDALGATH
jgi:hypothetical protein